ncbi:MAG: copper amine oxidase N-terminal domain-containing protein [Acidobacteriota bacterium]|nr:copper amine oxidase N-terminal domain-containing protein [Acidobacteriota bacterium]
MADAALLADSTVVYAGKVLPAEARPEVHDGAVMMSLKHLFEAADGAVYWFPDQKLARGITARADLAVREGSDRAVLNGETVPIKARPVASEGRLLVPLELLEKALGVTIRFDPVTRQINVRR